MDLDSIAIYWNSSDKLISHLTAKEEIRAALKSKVAKDGTPLNNLNYGGAFCSDQGLNDLMQFSTRW